MRIVVKLGTNILTEGGQLLSRPKMIDFVRQIVALTEVGHEVLMVSSGAIFAGREVLSTHQSKDIAFKQVLASIGQMRLMAQWEQFFAIYSTHVAQALLTRADLADRERYLNARNTLMSLIRLKFVPIINENDVVAIEEIKIGDNDNLSALVANLIDADLLIILTDQAGLFTADPRIDREARLIPVVKEIDEGVENLASTSRSGVGTGGMTTKIQAAKLATRSGTDVIIASGHEPNIVPRLVTGGESIGTKFPAVLSQLESRKRWLLAEAPQGDILLDRGAAEALKNNGKSLLPVGITEITGNFERGQIVRILGPNRRGIARGITNYSSANLDRIKGEQSTQINHILGYEYGPEVIHRDDMVLF